MLLIPTGTDAPIYHWPYATVGMMVLNVALLIAVPPVSGDPKLDENDEVVAVEPSNFERYALTLGNGLHPVQWLTHNFLHYGFMHLVGNLLFLWSFGIVVEGKLGALKYLILYLAIGTLHGALTQTLLLRSGLDGHAAGASAVVYGLLAVCMVWAPRNELNCTVIFWIGLRVLVYHWDLRYTTVALLYIGEQVLGLTFWGALGGRIMVSEMGHLSGAFWGSVLAIVLLKTGLVDCEGWDMFTLWAKRKHLGREWKSRGERIERDKKSLSASVKARVKAEAQERAALEKGAGADAGVGDRSTAAVQRVHRHLESGDVAAALASYDKSTRTLVNWPPKPELYAMIKALHAKGAEADSVRLMRDYCRIYPDDSGKVRLKLAQVLMRDRQRPVAALRVLEQIPAGSLTPDLETARQKLVRQADRMREEGVLELEGDD
jgi:membrane associated rhomboid family serine protease